MKPTHNKLHHQPRIQSPDWYAIVGENVHRMRKEQGLNKKTFSLMTGIGRPLLNKVERGEADLRISYLIKVADGLSVTPLDLLRPYDDQL